jgi:hypothetical protein
MVAYSIGDNNNIKEVVGGLLEGGGQSNNDEPETKPHMTAYMIEKIVKQDKSHQSAALINRIVDKIRAQQWSKVWCQNKRFFS